MSDIVQRLLEWGDLPSSVEFLDNVEAIFDPGNRDKSGAKPTDYLASWISMLRPYAYATSDGSWGELEKLLCIVMRNYVQVRRDAAEAAAEITRLRAALRQIQYEGDVHSNVIATATLGGSDAE